VGDTTRKSSDGLHSLCMLESNFHFFLLGDVAGKAGELKNLAAFVQHGKETYVVVPLTTKLLVLEESAIL
jgi:hypothetical protein